jgi:hypothetical protein
MSIPLEIEAVKAVFSPLQGDGAFDSDITKYLNELGQARPCVVLAFPPKAAGTYLRSAAIAAVEGKLVRTVHAQGGRDASFYLPTFLLYFAAGIPACPLVTHVHMQALAANRHFIEALGPEAGGHDPLVAGHASLLPGRAGRPAAAARQMAQHQGA